MTTLSNNMKYEIVNYGVEHSQFFQGISTHNTSYDHCVYGIGDTFNDALEDAISQLCERCNNDRESELAERMAKWITKAHTMNKKANAKTEIDRSEEDDGEPSELYHHVGILYSF